MFRLLIADDEELVRRGLTALIEREAPEIDVVETAVDGLEALELSERCRPDILLTDIRMPGLNGLDLIGRLRAAGPAPRCIVLSGYDDFEYARRAIGLDVAEYLLKPIDPDQLLGALTRVREGIEVARREERTRAAALQALQERQLQRLLSGGPAASASAEWLPAAPAWGLLLARGLGGGEASETAIERFRTLAREAVGGALLAEDGPGGCSVLCPLQAPDPEVFAALARSLHSRMEADGVQVALVAARPSEAPAALAGAYAEATAAAACARHSSGPLLCWEAPPGRGERWPMLPVSHREALLRAVAEGQEGDAARLAGAFVAYLEGHCAPAGQRALCVEMLMLIVHQCQNSGLPADAILGPEGDIGSLLAGTLGGGVEAQLVALVGRAARACGNGRAEPAARGAIPELRAYIEAHPEQDLSIAALGRRMHFSAKYLGELFKAATGEPLGSYVIRTRMRHAGALLAGTQLKVYAVAARVGYADAKHFATMFRAVVGVSPAEYRAAHRSGPAPTPDGDAPCHP